MQKILLAAALALLLQGCATLVGDESQVVPIRSTPPGASVTITDEAGQTIYRGATPADVPIRKSTGRYWGGKRFKVTVVKYGYLPQQFTLDTSPNAWYLAGNFLVSGGVGWFLVDPFSGKMYSLSPDGIDANLGRVIEERVPDKPPVAVPVPAPVPVTAPNGTGWTNPKIGLNEDLRHEAERKVSPVSINRGVAVGVGVGLTVSIAAGAPAGIAAGLAAGTAAAKGTSAPADPGATPSATPAATPAAAPTAAPTAAPAATPAATPAAPVAAPAPAPASPAPVAAAPAKDDGAARRKKEVETTIDAAPQGDFGASEAIRRYAPAQAPVSANVPAPAPPPFRQ